MSPSTPRVDYSKQKVVTSSVALMNPTIKRKYNEMLGNVVSERKREFIPTPVASHNSYNG
jgi:hypothetical protein